MTGSLMNIFLIGYRGTGKSTVAERLSAKVQMPWIDADESIEVLAGTSIKEIFSKQGESAFRDLETEVLENLAKRDGWILALGGGVIVRSKNRRTLSQTGPVFWLTAQVDTIQSRLSADPITDQRRPNLTVAGGVDGGRTGILNCLAGGISRQVRLIHNGCACGGDDNSCLVASDRAAVNRHRAVTGDNTRITVASDFAFVNRGMAAT